MAARRRRVIQEEPELGRSRRPTTHRSTPLSTRPGRRRRPRSGKDLWSLDSVKKLVPPPKKPSLMYRLYKSAKRAAGFKSTKKGLGRRTIPGVNPAAAAPAPPAPATAAATAATTTTAGSPLANDARLVNPFASLGKLDPSSPVPVPVSGSPPRPPGSLPSGESGGGGAPRARIAHPAEANAAERGETRKTFSVYSAYKGLRRRVRGDFSISQNDHTRRAGIPILPRVRRERNVDAVAATPSLRSMPPRGRAVLPRVRSTRPTPSPRPSPETSASGRGSSRGYRLPVPNPRLQSPPRRARTARRFA